MPESRYWRLGMKRSLRREIILCLEFIGTARENGRRGAVMDVLIHPISVDREENE